MVESNQDNHDNGNNADGLDEEKMMPNSNQKEVEERYYMRVHLAKRLVLITAILATILAVLLIANYLQTRSVDPLNSQAITSLMEQLRENPEDATLKDQIRALDLLARRAYFTHQWQLKTGGYLLFAFILVIILGLKYIRTRQSRLPDLTSTAPDNDSWANRMLSKRSIIIGGLTIFGLALILGLLSVNYLDPGGKKGRAEKAGTYASLEEMRQNWPGFRGPEGIGIAYNQDPPTEWDGASGKNIRWKVPLPLPGFNSPIIWGKRIFLSGAERNSQAIYCFDSENGTLLWQAELNDVPGSSEERPRPSPDTGHAAPTMTTDGVRVFVVFASGDAACYDFDGKRIWTKNLGVPDNHYGHSSSLITYRDLLFVQFDQNTGGRFMAFKTDTGNQVYDKSRDVQISWASPILVNTGNRDEVILNSNPAVISYNPLNGEELWQLPCMLGEVAPSLAYADGMVYAVNEYARLAAIKTSAPDEMAWEFIDDLSEVSSPLASGDYLVLAASYGSLSCFNNKTGERHWIEEFDEGFYSSPILAGDRVYLINMSGKTTIFKLGETYELIKENALGENAVTIPAFMHNRIYIRAEKNLYCIGE